MDLPFDPWWLLFVFIGAGVILLIGLVCMVGCLCGGGSGSSDGNYRMAEVTARAAVRHTDTADNWEIGASGVRLLPVATPLPACFSALWQGILRSVLFQTF
jgi:hypothetical protein